MSTQLEEVGRYLDLQEAEVVRTLLVGCGIPAEVFSDNQGNMVPYQAMVAPNRVLVPANRLAEAEAILAAQAPAPEGEPEVPAPVDEGKVAVRRVFIASVFGLLLIPVVPQLYSFWLARAVWPRFGTLARKDKVKFVGAMVLNVGILLILALLFLPMPRARSAPLEITPGEYLVSGGGGDATVTTVDGGIKISGSTFSEKYDVCEFEGVLKKGEDVLKVPLDEKSFCKIKVTLAPKGFSLTYEDPLVCSSLCGMSASAEQTYIKPDPLCADDKVKAARAAFKKQYDGKKFAEAVVTLSDLVGRCAEYLSFPDDGWIKNDLALAQLKAGDKPACLKTLSSMQNLADQLEFGYDGLGYPPAQVKVMTKLAKAIKTNLKLCGKK